jgi:hypothetical protein
MSEPARKLPDDPNLSEEANRLVAEELEEATGEPIERTRPSQAPPGRPASSLLTILANSRMLVAITSCAAVVFGVVLSLMVGSWWFVALAIAADVLGLLVVTRVVMGTLAQVERPRPETAAALEDEGVADPERLLNDRLAALDDGADRRSRAGRIVGPGDVDRATSAERDGRRAALEQQAAWTPTGGRPTEAVKGFAGPISVMPYAIAVGLLVISAIVPIAFNGGTLWVVPLVVWVAVAVFGGLDLVYRRRGR